MSLPPITRPNKSLLLQAAPSAVQEASQGVKRSKHRSKSSTKQWSSSDKERMGSPIKSVNAEQHPINQDFEALLGRNENFKVIRSLAPGANSSVFLCLDLRDQVCPGQPQEPRRAISVSMDVRKLLLTRLTKLSNPIEGRCIALLTVQVIEIQSIAASMLN